ncbi:hypothetical protein FACS1894122_05820 [Alphaproteobacteria bacterium]|nr:hypothetical protein FACS1894122_05820 [Alphaproteobacteria bacterium]
MNYKNIIAFIFLIVMQSVVATDTRPSAELLSGNNYKDAASYIKYADEHCHGIRTIIIGSGRGRGKNVGTNIDGKRALHNEVGDYAATVYQNPYNYLLVNWDGDNNGKTIQPDIVADITKIDPKVFGENQYDYVIFENVGNFYSFTKEAVQGAYKLLKEGGKIISSGMPGLLLKTDAHFDMNKQVNCIFKKRS